MMARTHNGKNIFYHGNAVQRRNIRVGTNIQSICWFYNRINCEAYVQQNFTILHEGLQLYLDMEGDEREIQSMGCTETTLEELRKLLQEEKTNTIAA